MRGYELRPDAAVIHQDIFRMPELNVSNGFTQRDYPRSAPRRGVIFLTSVFSYLGYQILEPLILIGIDARPRAGGDSGTGILIAALVVLEALSTSGRKRPSNLRRHRFLRARTTDVLGGPSLDAVLTE
jgi:hypothetical protein